MLSDLVICTAILMAIIEIGGWVFHVDRKWWGNG